MIARAVGIISDNGEEVMVQLPSEQELLDRVEHLTRQLGAERVNRYQAQLDLDATERAWKRRHADVCLFSFFIVLYAIAVTGLMLWGWLR